MEYLFYFVLIADLFAQIPADFAFLIEQTGFIPLTIRLISKAMFEINNIVIELLCPVEKTRKK